MHGASGAELANTGGGQPRASATLADGRGMLSNRLTVEAYRPDSGEMRQIFAGIGLTDRFQESALR